MFRTSISVYRGEWLMVVNEAMRQGGMTPPGTYFVDVAVDTAETRARRIEKVVSSLVSGGNRLAGARSYPWGRGPVLPR